MVTTIYKIKCDEIDLIEMNRFCSNQILKEKYIYTYIYMFIYQKLCIESMSSINSSMQKKSKLLHGLSISGVMFCNTSEIHKYTEWKQRSPIK